MAITLQQFIPDPAISQISIQYILKLIAPHKHISMIAQIKSKKDIVNTVNEQSDSYCVNLHKKLR